MKMKFIICIFFFLIISNTTKADIYWLYEFYNISSNFNIFSLNDDKYQQCLKEKLSEKDYKKAIEYESSISQEMESVADQCVEKLLVSQSNTKLQLCLQNELSNQSYNILITKHFSKNPKKSDFKAFYKCLSELKTNIVVASNEKYNESNSCPEGYKLVNNSCQSDGSTSSNSCPEGYKLINNSCQSGGSVGSGSCPEGSKLVNNTCKFDESKKTSSEKKDGNILSDEAAYGSKKSYAKQWIEIMNEIISLLQKSQINNKQKAIDIVNNSISVFKRMENANLEQKNSAGKQLIDVKNLLEKNFKENKNIEKYKDVLIKLSGIMTSGRPPADIFLANKVYDCKSYTEPFFAHHVTDLSKIKEILPWGSVRTGGGATDNLKNHTYFISKKKGTEFPLYAPTDSYLIGYDAYYLYESPDVIHFMLYFQASCDIAYRFDHLDKIEQSLKNKIGNIIIQDVQHKSKIIPIKPAIFIKGGQLVAKTKGTPKHDTGGFDFGLYNKNNNNQLPKRLLTHKGSEQERIFRFADCPYDYFIKDLKKSYYKKIKKKRCGPKEIKKNN